MRQLRSAAGSHVETRDMESLVLERPLGQQHYVGPLRACGRSRPICNARLAPPRPTDVCLPAEQTYSAAVADINGALMGGNIETARVALRSLLGTIPVFQEGRRPGCPPNDEPDCTTAVTGHRTINCSGGAISTVLVSRSRWHIERRVQCVVRVSACYTESPHVTRYFTRSDCADTRDASEIAATLLINIESVPGLRRSAIGSSYTVLGMPGSGALLKHGYSSQTSCVRRPARSLPMLPPIQCSIYIRNAGRYMFVPLVGTRSGWARGRQPRVADWPCFCRKPCNGPRMLLPSGRS